MLRQDLDYDVGDLTLEVIQRLYLAAAKKLARSFKAIDDAIASPTESKKSEDKSSDAEAPAKRVSKAEKKKKSESGFASA